MKKYKIEINRTIGQMYEFEIEAENEEQAEIIYKNLSWIDELDFKDAKLAYHEVHEEFIDNIEEIKKGN